MRLIEGIFGLIVTVMALALSALALAVSLVLMLLAPFLVVLFDFRTVRNEMRAIRERDPAARGVIERVLCYPGFHAIFMHRFIHFLHKRLHIPLIPRIMSQIVRQFTGVEIHPGATIGQSVFIDHGMDVVVGETSQIGDNCTIFQGVTLGGTGKERGKRHPTLEEDVVVGAGARILGDITIGKGARIGSGSVVVNDVPPEATVVGVPGRIVTHRGRKIPGASLDHGNLPDPVKEALETLNVRIRETEDLIHREHDFLQDVGACKRREVGAARSRRGLDELKKQAAGTLHDRVDFGRVISSGGISLIGEIKKASPSQGVIREDFDPQALARALKEGGASALSVLTDRCYFQGDLEYIQQAREATELPVLRKDFIIDPYQVWEAAAAGADAVLLIVRMLGEDRLKEMLKEVEEAGLSALVETHDQQDIDAAVSAGASVIGINSRDLASLEVDVETFFKLSGSIPDDAVKVAESGIETLETVRRLEEAGFDAVLVGSFLMRQDDVSKAARELLGKS